MSIEMDFPVYEDIIAARRFISSYLPSTPLVGVHSLSQLLEFDYHIKCENLQPVGAFKVRGGAEERVQQAHHAEVVDEAR